MQDNHTMAVSSLPIGWSDDHLDVLHDFDVCAAAASDCAGWIVLFDFDGDEVVRVPATIDAPTLRVVFHYGKREFDRGTRFGRTKLQGQLRALLGACTADEARLGMQAAPDPF